VKEQSTKVLEIPLERLADGQVVRHRSGAQEILLLRHEGVVRAYNGICPHLAGPLLEATIEAGKITCPWHRYRYDLGSGRCETVQGLSWENCDRVELAVEAMPLALGEFRVDVGETTVSVFDESPR
jgi:nitrite reductase/ring-hydroxylating ferredoxin subunit